MMKPFLHASIVLAGCLLVSSAGAEQLCKTGSIRPTAPASDFIDNKDGTVTHKRSGLVWMRCALGQTWDGSACKGEPKRYLWRQALQEAEAADYTGHKDWRLPNVKELESIAELQCHNPAINLEVFPGTPPYRFWSSSLFMMKKLGSAWFVNYSEGYTDDGRVGDPDHPEEFDRFSYFVRLVRGGAAADSYDKLR